MKTNRTVPHKRKRNGKTDYKKRLELLKSRKPRVVIRTTNSQIIVQIIEYNPEGDDILAEAKATDLEEHGWEHNTKNLPAAYLTGLIASKKADVDEGVLDIGLQNRHKGGRIYAGLKGVIDGGINVPASEEAFPSQQRLEGQHISEDVQDNFQDVKQKVSE